MKPGIDCPLTLHTSSTPRLSTGHYDLGYRFDFSKPVKVKFQNQSLISESAYLRAALDMQAALPDLRFELADNNLLTPPFENTIIFAEIESDMWFYGLALAGHVGSDGFKPCYGSHWDLVIRDGIVKDLKGITGELTGQRAANCGLILINTRRLIRDFGCDMAEGFKIYLSVHEPTHLWGMGHDTEGVMVPGIAKNIPVDIRYTKDDKIGLAEMGYRVSGINA